jgi:hypothetical protein
VESWLALPLMDIALDAQFVAGSRLREFQAARLRLQFLSILLHEINHMVRSQEAERVPGSAAAPAISQYPPARD